MTAPKLFPVIITERNKDIFLVIQAILQDDEVKSVKANIFKAEKECDSLVALVQSHRPNMIIYDMSQPYIRNWQFFRTLLEANLFAGSQIVMTTTDKQIVNNLKASTDTFEVISKPFDIRDMRQLIDRAKKIPYYPLQMKMLH